MKPKILVVGSSNTDFVIRASRLPKPGETLMGEEARSSGGGKGANQAVAAARSGAGVIFVGARGDDEWGRTAFQNLSREGIDLRHFSIKKKSTSGSAFILIGGASSQNMIVVAGGSNDLLSPEDVSKAFKQFTKLDAVVCQLEVPLKAVLQAA
ncbi:MAG: ribokinase, partial [Spirochaetia bacterium]|nr:ribokinase [Spirochaetia bacterium]